MSITNSKTIFERELLSWATSGNPSNRQGKEEAVKKITAAFETRATALNLDCLRMGDLPECICDLTNLTSLSLRGNDLSELPEELGKLSKLRMLNLCYNRNLTGLPASLAKLPSLHDIFTGSTGISDKKLNDLQSQIRSLAIQDLIVEKRGQLQKEKLLFSQRPLEVQEKIDEVYNSLTKKAINWGHDGRVGFYNLFGFKDEDIITQRIERASPNKKDLYFIDLGTGYGAWVDAAGSFLKREYSSSDHHFHVIGVTGEGMPEDVKVVNGNVTTHKISGFKLENLLDSFEQFDLHLVNSVEFIVTSWTLQHLVDPLGTVDQAYHLLNSGNGFIFGTGWLADFGIENTLSKAFGMHNYMTKKGDQGLDSFAVFRSDEDRSTSFAAQNFTYNRNDHLHTFDNFGIDSYAQTKANLINKEFSPNLDYNIGGGIFGSGTYVLEQLFGRGGNRRIPGHMVLPTSSLFEEPLLLKRYLDAGCGLEVDK